MISEDNPLAWRILNQFANDIVSIISNSERTERNILLRTVSAAILSNVPSLSTLYVHQIFETLNQVLDVNHRTLLGKLTSSIPLIENETENNIGVEVASDEQMDQETEEEATQRRRKQDLPSAYDIEVKNVGWILVAQRIAAETITNICSFDENGNIQFTKNYEYVSHMKLFNQFDKFVIDASTLDDDDDLSDAESVHDYEQNSSSSSNGLQADKLPMEIMEPIKSFGLVEKLWQRAQPIAENVNELLKLNEKELSQKYETI